MSCRSDAGPSGLSLSLRCRGDQVTFMKRMAEMSDLGPVLRALPRIKKHLLNPDNMRSGASYTTISNTSTVIRFVGLFTL